MWWQRVGRAMLLTVEGLAVGVMIAMALTGGF